MKNEEWKQIPGWSNYFISNFGRAKSSRGIIKLALTRKGYPRVMLYNGKQRKGLMVHSLVLQLFIGPRPLGHVACHLNNLKTDNRVENLKWGTQKENEAHKRLHGTSPQGERHPRSKLTTKQVEEIRSRYRRPHPTQSNARILAKEYGVTSGTIARIIGGRLWTHL